MIDIYNKYKLYSVVNAIAALDYAGSKWDCFVGSRYYIMYLHLLSFAIHVPLAP